MLLPEFSIHMEAFDSFPCCMMKFLCYSCSALRRAHYIKEASQLTDQQTARSSSTDNTANYP